MKTTTKDILSLSLVGADTIEREMTQEIGEAAFINGVMLIKLPNNLVAKLVLDYYGPSVAGNCSPNAIAVHVINKRAHSLDKQPFCFQNYFVNKDKNANPTAVNFAVRQYPKDGEMLLQGVDPTPESVLKLISEIKRYLTYFK